MLPHELNVRATVVERLSFDSLPGRGGPYSGPKCLFGELMAAGTVPEGMIWKSPACVWAVGTRSAGRVHPECAEPPGLPREAWPGAVRSLQGYLAEPAWSCEVPLAIPRKAHPEVVQEPPCPPRKPGPESVRSHQGYLAQPSQEFGQALGSTLQSSPGRFC